MMQHDLCQFNQVLQIAAIGNMLTDAFSITKAFQVAVNDLGKDTALDGRPSQYFHQRCVTTALATT
jgi:hypothetical protein